MKRIAFTLSVGVLFGGAFLLSAVADRNRDAQNSSRDDSPPAAYAIESDKTQHVVFRDSDGNLIELYNKQNDASGWMRRDLTAATKAPKAAGNPAGYVQDNVQHLVYRGTDGRIHELFLAEKGKWGHNDLTEMAKAPKAAGNPAGYVQDMTQHVVFRDTEGQVCELFLAKKGKWGLTNLTAEAKAPKAVGDPKGYALKDKTQHVVYRGAEGQIIELYVAPKQEKWAHNNLTDKAKAPKAAGNPAGYVLGTDQHVVYRGTDGNIHELVLAEKGKWAHNNLTAETKAPKAAGNPAGYVLKDNLIRKSQNTQHVVYRGTDDQIYELYVSAKQGKWSYDNLTETAKAPKAGGDPTGYTLAAIQHVVYRGANGHIQELVLAEKGKWAHTDLSDKAKSR